jgi:hypothetical protein
MAKKKRIKDKVKDLEKDFKDQFAAYQRAQEILSGFAGQEWKDIGKDNVSKMLKDIQTNFIELYPILEFVLAYNTPAHKILQSYNIFVDTLKTQGVIFSKEPPAEA